MKNKLEEFINFLIEAVKEGKAKELNVRIDMARLLEIYCKYYDSNQNQDLLDILEKLK